MVTPDQVSRADLLAWMASHGYSVRGLAAALGVSAPTVQRWRDGSVAPPAWLSVALRGLEADAR
ncbi:MAG: helix-turn-helix domain-containing protein [Dehalococcoidia bacterium]|nr:helix-turn-helix domain-containing protein [Dehalococcoidia bacterium]